MNQHLLKHIKKYNTEHGYRCKTPADYLETLRECGEDLYRGEPSHHRWYYEFFHVVKLDGKLIGFTDAKATGDVNAKEAGWEFELSSICDVEEKTIVIYQPVN